MEEKRYPIIEEEKDFSDYPDDYDPGKGPYTMEELNSRIDKAEQDLHDPDKWIRVDDFWASMRKEHRWLRLYKPYIFSNDKLRAILSVCF